MQTFICHESMYGSHTVQGQYYISWFSYEVIRDLNTVCEAIIAEKREILMFFVNKYRQYLPRKIYKTDDIPSSGVDQLSSCLLPQDVPMNLVPLKATGNGNCLFNSSSILQVGSELNNITHNITHNTCDIWHLYAVTSSKNIN